MTINLDLESLRQQGIPDIHALAFGEAAQTKNSIILTRVPGKACYDMLRDGYDAKSFHIKGKSCNWGPMAGFVCLDPLLNKKGVDGALSNVKYHYAALNKQYQATSDGPITFASYTPIFVTTEHLKTLGITPEGETYTDIAEFGIIKFSFLLEKQEKFQDNSGQTLWQLFYCLEDVYQSKKVDSVDSLLDGFAKLCDLPEKEQEKAKYVLQVLYTASLSAESKENDKKRYVPVCAMTNPYDCYPEGDYRNAITGDYDLFAVWPDTKAPSYSAEDDKRVAGMNQTMSGDAGNNSIIAGENASPIGQVVGNISQRVFKLAQVINSMMPDTPNRVYHSDEGGRPFVDDIDLPVAVFAPESAMLDHTYSGFVIQDVEQFVNYINNLPKEYAIFVNKGWRDKLKNEVKDASRLQDSGKIGS